VPARAANDPLIVWQGGATITSLNNTCRNNTPFSVGDVLLSVFRPRLVGDEPASAVSLLTGRFAQAFFRSGGAGGDQMHGPGTYTGPLIGGRATSIPGGASGTYSLKIKPAVIAAGTNVITIQGTITKFAGVSGCTMKFAAAYRPRGN